MSVALAPVDATEHATAAPPSPWGVFGSPAALFTAVAADPQPRRALRWLLWTLPVMPAAIAVGSYGAVHSAMINSPDLASRASAAPLVSASAGILAVVVQGVMLLMHLALFVAMVGWLRSAGTRRAAVTVWAYAMFPLVLRQVFLLMVIGTQGLDWFRDHAAIITFVDPFICLVGFLFYVGCRRVLELSMSRAALVAVLSSVVGMLGAIGASTN
jgi:hypothetical protein